jgi:hypothetical protein
VFGLFRKVCCCCGCSVMQESVDLGFEGLHGNARRMGESMCCDMDMILCNESHLRLGFGTIEIRSSEGESSIGYE